MRFLTLLLVALPVAAVAQDAPAPWKINATLDFRLIDSNRKTESFTVLANGALDRPDYSIRLEGGIAKARQTEANSSDFETVTDFWFIGGRYDRNASNRMSYYGSARFRRDNPAGVDLRQQYGLGLAYLIHPKDTWRWSTSAGVAFIRDKYTGDIGSSNNTGVEFGSDYWRKINDKLEISHVFSYIPNVEELSDYLMLSTLNVNYSISKDFGLTLAHLLDYRSKPGTGALRQSQQYILGITYRTTL